MAQGEVVSDIASLIAAGQTYDIRPAAGVEWIIHNIYFSKGIEIFRYNGSSLIPLRTFADFGQWEWLDFHLTNGNYVRLRSIRSGTTKVGFDGVQTK